MKLIASILVYLVAVLHIWFMVLESFLWTKPLGRKTFKMSQEKAEITKVLALNQGLYNGFLAAGLIWGTCLQDFGIIVFFLTCVMVAGIVGALSVGRSILFIQFFPALLAFVLTYLTRG